MSNQYQESYSRNIGVFTETEQEQLRNSTIAVAGVGGIGGLLVERLIRMGVGNIRITDLGTYEQSNLNRQYGSSMLTLERYKAEVVHDNIKEIYPEANVYYDNNGITSEEGASQFIEGTDLVIDEMDYGAWKESIYLQRAARKRGVYYLFAGAIGFGALLTNFDPLGITLEEYNKIPPNYGLEKLGELSVPTERILPVVPSYATNAMSMEMLQEIIAGQRPVPTCSVGVGLASVLAASNAINILLKRKEVVKAPQYMYIDLLDQIFLTGSVSEPAENLKQFGLLGNPA
jgi:molybdopterin/thiamine biosynthesis adenylyltransferase